MPWVLGATDNFNRANENPIGPPWYPIDTQQPLNNRIVSQQYQNYISLGCYYQDGQTYSNDQYAQINTTGTNNEGSLAVRITPGNTATVKCYFYYRTWNYVYLYKQLNSTTTTIGTVFTGRYGFTNRLEVSGTTITGYYNGVSGSATDSSIAGGTVPPGMYAVSVGGYYMDDFECGATSIAGAGAGLQLRRFGGMPNNPPQSANRRRVW